MLREFRELIRLSPGPFAVTGLFYFFRLILVWISSPEYLVSLTPDDFYYYVQVARNMSAGAGSTFDGVNLTNGYHPLWMMVCTLVGFAVAPGSIDLSVLLLHARLMLSLQLALGLVGIWLLLLAFWRLLESKEALLVAAGLLCLPMVVYASTDGLESGLVLFLLGGLFLFSTLHPPTDPQPLRVALSMGALLAVLFLARLDTVLLAMAFGLVLLHPRLGHRSGFGSGFMQGFLWAIPVVVSGLAYFAINQTHFGMLEPISGKLKSGFPYPQFSEVHFLRSLPAILFLLMALVGFFLGPKNSRILNFLLAGGTTFMVCHLIHSIFFMRWGVHLWHFTVYWFFGALGMASLVARYPTRGRLLLIPLLIASVTGQYSFLYQRQERAFQAQSYRAALWVRENVEPWRMIGMSDCGVFGYYRGGNVVNLDGLINSMEYQNHLFTRGIASYLREQRVTLLAHHAIAQAALAEPTYSYTRRSPLWLFNKGDNTILLRRSHVVYRGDAYHDGRGLKHFVIWRLHAPSRLTDRQDELPQSR